MKFLQVTFLFFLCFSCNQGSTNYQESSQTEVNIKAVNERQLPAGNGIIVVENVNLIDGTGGEAKPNTTVVVSGNLITEIGSASAITMPDATEVIDGEGLSLLPGLIDAHFHLDGNNQFPGLFLKNGVTSVRDPGAWIESYEAVRQSGEALPRLFLTGPHLDMPPPAYPRNSYLIRDKTEAEYAVNLFANQGASAIKVYFRLPVTLIEAICKTADRRGIPVTAHLEITGAMQAIEAGVGGIEHITSFGTDLLPTRQAEQYKQSVLADNNARREGRYRTWDAIDLSHPRVDSLINFLLSRGTVVTPTLGAFEHQFSTDTLSVEEAFALGRRYVANDAMDTLKVSAFQNMLTFTGMLHEAGVTVVVGSHSWVPYQRETGWSYQHEMELLAQCGMRNTEIIRAATLENARFLRIADRLGTVEVGKQADLLLLEGDPLQNLEALYEVRKVMLNGKWVE